MSRSIHPQRPLIGDPTPRRRGQFEPGMLTRRELEKVVEVLRAAKGSKRVHYEPAQDEDTWTAFGSLLHGGYIRETYQGSQQWVLTPRGALYLEQLEGDSDPLVEVLGRIRERVRAGEVPGVAARNATGPHDARMRARELISARAARGGYADPVKMMDELIREAGGR